MEESRRIALGRKTPAAKVAALTAPRVPSGAPGFPGVEPETMGSVPPRHSAGAFAHSVPRAV